jgi:hypothetical protein
MKRTYYEVRACDSYMLVDHEELFNTIKWLKRRVNGRRHLNTFAQTAPTASDHQFKVLVCRDRFKRDSDLL